MVAAGLFGPFLVSWALLLAVSVSIAETELVLVDGTVLSGKEVRREGNLYFLVLENGNEISIPVELVESVQLSGHGETQLPEQPGLIRSDPRELAGTIPEGPSGIRAGESQTLVGEEVTAPRTADQLAVFGESARFQQNIVDNQWTPESDWDMDPEKNNFNPVTWSKSIVDNSWAPTSAFDKDENVLEPGQSKWRKSIIDSSWKPTDGFAK